MTTIPPIKTSAEQLREDYERDPNRTLFLGLMEALGASVSGSHSRLPEFSSPDEVERKAREDFRRADYSDAMTYIDSLVKIADHYREYAEQYHAELIGAGAVMRDGVVSRPPFIIVDNDEIIFATSEVFSLADDAGEALTALLEMAPQITNEYQQKSIAALIHRVKERADARAAQGESPHG